ncbi:hypothetical protein [Rubritalea sp.]|uniref:hypothetical protein n=1 Tax=Rubritalea sp. TaxID=2109375 RepID=UPI003EF16B8B
MTENRVLLTRLVAQELTNQKIADAMSEEIGDVISAPQVARFKREFGLVKSSEKPPELIIEKIPRSNAALERMLKLLFSKQIEELEKNSTSLQISPYLFKVDGESMDLESFNALYLEKVQELERLSEKQQAIAKLKALGVDEKELLELMKKSE